MAPLEGESGVPRRVAAAQRRAPDRRAAAALSARSRQTLRLGAPAGARRAIHPHRRDRRRRAARHFSRDTLAQLSARQAAQHHPRPALQHGRRPQPGARFRRGAAGAGARAGGSMRSRRGGLSRRRSRPSDTSSRRRPARVTIVGEPVGDRLEFWAEGGIRDLPMGAKLLLATERHNYQTGCPEADCHGSIRDHPIRVESLQPDIAAPLRFADFRAGRDPSMAAIDRDIRSRRGYAKALPRSPRLSSGSARIDHHVVDPRLRRSAPHRARSIPRPPLPRLRGAPRASRQSGCGPSRRRRGGAPGRSSIGGRKRPAPARTAVPCGRLPPPA